jgi:hypothetical protein
MHPRTVKAHHFCTRWRVALATLRELRKASRLAHRQQRPHLTNRQIRLITITIHSHARSARAHSAESIATLQQRLSFLNHHTPPTTTNTK